MFLSNGRSVWSIEFSKLLRNSAVSLQHLQDGFSGRCRRFIESQHLIHLRFPVKVPDYLKPSSIPHGTPLLRVCGESNQSKRQIINEGLPGGGFDKNSTRGIEIVERSAPCRGNDRHFHRHGLEHDGATALVHARQHQGIAMGELPGAVSL
jgi:hypothetical protein